MAVIRKRQISNEDKKTILDIYGKKCYATGHEISDDSEIQFDHIKAFTTKGTSEIDNIAPMCAEHNLKKGRLPLGDYRIKLQLEDFFQEEQTLTLKDELEYFKNKKLIKDYGRSCYFKMDGNKIEIETNDKKSIHELFTCPVTQWKYFHTLISIESINSDDDAEGEIGLQPRYLIFDKVFNMYRHFQRHPVLQPSLARLYTNKNKILVFDGQHKIAAMLWEGRKNVELKIYIDPDPQVLNNTNIAAHDKFAQTRFYSSIMVSKLGGQFGKQFEDYKNKDEDIKKSEAGFVQFLRIEEELTKGEVNKRFNSFLFKMVLDVNENKASKYLSRSNRSTNENPLTVDMLSKSILANFLYQHPIDEDLRSEHYKRDKEINNLIKLFNILYDEALCSWDSEKDSRNTNQNKLSRMFKSKSIMSWAEVLKGGITAHIGSLDVDINDVDEKERIFYRELTDNSFSKIRDIVRRLVEWPLWSSPVDSEIDRILSNNKSIVKKYMKDNGLTPTYLLGASS